MRLIVYLIIAPTTGFKASTCDCVTTTNAGDPTLRSANAIAALAWLSTEDLLRVLHPHSDDDAALVALERNRTRKS